MQFIPKPKGLVPVVDMKLGQPQPFVPPDPKLPNDVLENQPDKLPIVSLWSGPGSTSAVSLLAGRSLLEKHEYDGVKIHFSQIPFRVS